MWGEFGDSLVDVVVCDFSKEVIKDITAFSLLPCRSFTLGEAS